MNGSCRPRKWAGPLELLSTVPGILIPDCSASPGPAFTGRTLPASRKVVLMILFSFEVDTLEISLREQQDDLDMIFIVESTVSHRGVSKHCPVHALCEVS